MAAYLHELIGYLAAYPHAGWMAVFAAALLESVRTVRQLLPQQHAGLRGQASTAVNSASNVSISEALVPLVCCSPQASDTGPTTAPKAAIHPL